MLDVRRARTTASALQQLSRMEMTEKRFDDAERHLAQATVLGATPKGAWSDLLHARFRASHLPPDDFWTTMPTILSRVERDFRTGAEPSTVGRGLRALSRIAELQGRLWTASERTGIDIHAQWNAIAQAQGVTPSQPLSVLTSRLYYANASDLLAQFYEIVLTDSYGAIRYSPRKAHVIDGGANVGMALAYFKCLRPESEILAFEPNPHLFAICKRNIEENRWKGITLLPHALAGHHATVEFHCDLEMPMASSLTCRAGGGDRHPCETVTVGARPLGDYIIQNVDFLKLDIEGSEQEVIVELGAKLAMVQNGFIEYHYFDGDAGGNALSGIIRALETNGHVYFIGEQPTIIPPTAQMSNLIPSHRWSGSLYFRRRA
jgi:FkbM family methyltransferase